MVRSSATLSVRPQQVNNRTCFALHKSHTDLRARHQTFISQRRRKREKQTFRTSKRLNRNLPPLPRASHERSQPPHRLPPDPRREILRAQLVRATWRPSRLPHRLAAHHALRMRSASTILIRSGHGHGSQASHPTRTCISTTIHGSRNGPPDPESLVKLLCSLLARRERLLICRRGGRRGRIGRRGRLSGRTGRLGRRSDGRLVSLVCALVNSNVAHGLRNRSGEMERLRTGA